MGAVVTPELKCISSVDWDGSTEVPIGSCIWFHLEIGEAERPGADLFQIGVCDRAWRDANIKDKSKEFFVGDVHFASEAILLLETIDMNRIKHAVASVLSSLGPFDDWREFGQAMKGIAIWEFEGM